MLILSMRLLSLNSFLLGILRHCWPITGFDVVSPAQPSGGITVHVSCTPHKQQRSVPRYASLTHKNMTGTWHLSIFFARFFFVTLSCRMTAIEALLAGPNARCCCYRPSVFAFSHVVLHRQIWSLCLLWEQTCRTRCCLPLEWFFFVCTRL